MQHQQPAAPVQQAVGDGVGRKHVLRPPLKAGVDAKDGQQLQAN